MSDKTVSCSNCGNSFSSGSNLRRHIRTKHDPASLPKRRHCGGRKSSKMSSFACAHCCRQFVSNSSLRRHIRQHHAGAGLPGSPPKGRRPVNLQKTNLPASLHRPTVEKYEFSSEHEFFEWKTKLEQSACVRFVKHRKDSKRGVVTYRWYYCHRSGFLRSMGRGVRRTKIQGSAKIQGKCSAAIFIRIGNAGTVNAAYHSTHQGHELELAHQPLLRQKRTEIAGLLAMGVPFDDVLDRLQLCGDHTSVSRNHFINKQDLRNIVRDFSISKFTSSRLSDAESVAAWVEQDRMAGGARLVRYVKSPGEQDERGLAPADFMLIIISEPQIAVLGKLYRPMKEVVLDSTHGTNAYDYQLTTLMIIDEHGEGFPAAFCLSNRVDEMAMRLFLTVCTETLGRRLEGAVLMTDDTEVYVNAWISVMGPPAFRLLCTWHIDRAWRKNMSKIRGDTQLKAKIYKLIRALMEIPNKDIFVKKLSEFMQISAEDERTAEFGKYFGKEYASRPELWAYCHHPGLRVHHKMHLEALHRVLKHVHMAGRKVRRMDRCIHALLHLLRSRMKDRLVKINKGKWTQHLLGIRKRHQKGLSLDPQTITVIVPNKIYLCRGSKKNEEYCVEQSDTLPHQQLTCPLHCEDCGICSHTFMCNCSDFGLRQTICKHIHLVVSAYKPVISCLPETDISQLNTLPIGENNAVEGENSVINVEVSSCSDIIVKMEEVIEENRTLLLNETDAVLHNLHSSALKDTIEKYVEMAKQQCCSILTDMRKSPEIAAAACSQLLHVNSLIAAMKTRPNIGDVSGPKEPENKKINNATSFFFNKEQEK